MNAELIAKETIDVHKIIPADNNLDEELVAKLARTARLGNEFKSKAIISFNTTEGIKKVETTVWAVTEKFIQLKNNIHIPIKSIVNIDF